MKSALFENVNRTFQHDVLDGVRGLAVLLVILSHLANKDILLFEGLKYSGNGSGKVGVYLFFVLSSFLLTRIALRNVRNGFVNYIVWKEFFLRRFLRIFPLYTLALVVVFVGSSYKLIAFQDFADFKGLDIVWHLLMIKGDMHFWSIATEVKYYLSIPFFIWLYSRFFAYSVKHIFILTVILSMILSFLSRELFSYQELRFSLVRYMPIFVWGAFYAVLYECKPVFIKNIYEKRWLSLLLGVVIVLFIFLLPNVYQPIMGLKYPFLHPKYAFFWGAFLGLFVYLILGSKGIFNYILCSLPMRLLGVCSFSVYIWHVFILKWVSELAGLSNLEKIILFFTLVFVSGLVSFAFIERPFSLLRFGKQSAT